MNDKKRVIALGFFDGVHKGHQALLRRTVQQAQHLDAIPAVITFDAHPDTFVQGVEVPLLGSIEDRKELISRVGGIDDVIIIHFDRDFMQTPWDVFLAGVRERLGAVHLVMGRDFCCGYRGAGTSERIAGWCDENGLGCDVVEEVTIDGVTVSSTYIRGLVARGDMEQAALYLGHPHAITGTVAGGRGVGRKIGAPTVNIPIPEGVITPRRGVYAARVWLPDGPKAAVTNVGVRPTFEGDGHVTVESNLLDFQGELYGESIRVELLRFLRDERRFPSPEELGEQIQRDAAEAGAYFRRCGEPRP